MDWTNPNRWLTFIVALFAAVLLAVTVAQPPEALPTTAPAGAFSAARAMADIREIARDPHPTGSAENARVRGYLVTRLRQLGFEVRLVSVPMSEKARERLVKQTGRSADRAINIVAVRPGVDTRDQLVALMAHYDTVGGSPGAADDSAGVAAALEIARAVGQTRQRRGLAIIFTDGEELGLEGAKGFFTSDALKRRIGALINLEARGGGGRAIMFETGPGNGNMIGLFSTSVRDPSANSLAVRIYELLPNSTDFTPAKAFGIAGFNFAFMDRAYLYHSPMATPDAIDPQSVQHLGAQALDVTAALLKIATLPDRAPDAVFADVLGRFVVTYPPLVGWPLLAIAGVLLAVAMRRDMGRTLPVAGGVALAVLFALLVAGLTWAANWLSGISGTENYYDRLAALPRLMLQALMMTLAALLFVIAGTGRPQSFRGTWIGLALANLVVGIAVQIFLPAAGPLFVWPLLPALLVLAVAAPDREPPLGVAGVVAIFALAQVGGFGYFAMLAIGTTSPWVIAVLAPTVLLLLWPLLPPFPPRIPELTALMLIIGAGVVAMSVRLDPIALSVPRYSLDPAR